MKKLNAIFLLERPAYDVVYAPGPAAAIGGRVQLLAPPLDRGKLLDAPGCLAEVDLIFSGWGMPRADRAFLDAAPNLKAIFYAAGAVNGWATDAMWRRGVVVTTANDANAIPVAEYTVAAALFSLKNGWKLMRPNERGRGFHIRDDIAGNYRAVVGLVGMGSIARLVTRLLRPFDVTVLAYDPYLTPDEARGLGVERVGLDEVFARSDVVSLHAPDLPDTRGMVDAARLRSMRPGATLINTSRGRLVCESDLAIVLGERADLHAVLDVTAVEPLPATSPLLALPNLTLTPHIAGSQGRECERMGQYMVDELDRYLAGEPLKWQVRPDELAHSVHQPTLSAAADLESLAAV